MISSRPEDGIRRTIAQYCQLCDDGRFDEWIALFTADARFHVMGKTTVGRDAIKAFIEVGQTRRACGAATRPSQSVIDVGDDCRSAKAWTDFCFVDKAHTITTVGRYHDEMVLGTDGRWRFALREIVFLGGEPELATRTPG